MKTETDHFAYPAVGHCIYCGDDKAALTLEHIIPFGLGGRWELDQASCMACAKVINPFETFMARDMLRPFRAKFGFKSRKRQMPVTLPFDILDGAQTKTIELRVRDHPGILLLPQLPQPWALSGLEPFRPATFDMKFWHFPDRAGLDALQKRLGGKKVNLGLLRHDYLWRQLAKIAHAYACAELGLDGFQPLLPAMILGKDDNFTWLVGGTYDNQPKAEALHVVTLEDWVVDDLTYIVTNLQLFASLGAPLYRVVTGIRQKT